MSDHPHDHSSDHGSHGIPLPPSDEVLMQFEGGNVRGAEPVPLHFFMGPGPMDVRRVPRKRVRRAGSSTWHICHYEFRWFLDVVKGVSRSKALTRMYDVVLADNGWIQSGVHWKRVMDRAQADIVIRVLPQDETVCGPGSAGCYSWGYEADQKPVAEMGVEYIERPGPWAALTNMELIGHGTFRADDMYWAIHLPYVGVMGNWEAMARAGYMPTEQEVADTELWLQGQTPSDRIHRH